ncbi:hypothetical protein HID58_042671 [Brassica napus]|uniref:Uncharacterized protein n=1 Tax=Brassica napus TaxID=3708 RepID=A0ABQ8BEP8_BRANA|nr:hypothetical protein HID58_042671 [Brassica napus]
MVWLPASRVNPWARSGSRPVSPGRVVFAWGGSNPDDDCHHRPVLALGLPRPDNGMFLHVLFS